MPEEKHFEFNDIPNKAGVYYIYNIQNGKAYVGSSQDLRERLHHHLRTLRGSCHFNKHLQRAWIKYGEEKFAFRVIELVDRENLIDREQLYIDLMESPNKDKGYNICPKARNTAGRTVSQKTRKKLSKAASGKNHWLYDKHLSKETRKKISEALQGEKNPNYGKTGKDAAFYGRHHSEKSRQKISESNKKTFRKQLKDYDKKRGQLSLFPKIYSKF